MKQPRRILYIRNKPLVPPPISVSFCIFLVFISRATIFNDDSSSSSWSSLAVLAFPLPSLSSSSSSSSTATRIRSHLESNSNFENNQDEIDGNNYQHQQRYEQQEQQQKEQLPPRRRIFLEQAALAATTMVGGGILGGVSQIVPTSAAYAMDIDSKNAAAASAEAGIKVSKKAQGGGLAQRIRGGVCFKMDELQRDLMQERWDLLPPYPAQLRSYVSIFTTYTDAAFPSDSPSDYGLRVAMRYEVGRFFASVERLKRAIAKQSLEEAYTAYADMSLHLDRYLRVGGLYTYYDSVVDNELLFKEFNDALVYSDPVKDPAEVRDLVVLCRGPDKGKTGILIGVYPQTDKSNNCVVKLDKYRGMREIRVVPRSWAAKRLGEQAPDPVFLIPRK